MKERTRVAAIIVQGSKLLLVKGAKKYKEYWTPGGTRKSGESDLECIHRELEEELRVKVISTKFFGEYKEQSPYIKDETVIIKVYIVNISGTIKVHHEIKGHVWMSREEFYNGKYPLIATTGNFIIPDLIKAGIF